MRRAQTEKVRIAVDEKKVEMVSKKVKMKADGKGTT